MNRFWAVERVGKQGNIWRGKDTETDEDVCMKLMDVEGNRDYDERNERVRMEAHALKELSSLDTDGRILQFKAFYINDERQYVLVTELAMCSLQDVLDVHGSLSEFQAQVVMRAVMEALVSCHARYYVHRDVKPSNLLLFNRDLNSIKLADFGIAAEDNGYSCVGGIKGTKGYMAPEILKKRQYGRPADIFSAGILTSTLFNNKPPSAMASDFIALLTQQNPDARPTASQVLKHAWLSSIPPNTSCEFSMTPKVNPHPVDGFPSWLLLIPENPSQCAYYFEKVTGVTQWTHPDGVSGKYVRWDAPASWRAQSPGASGAEDEEADFLATRLKTVKPVLQKTGEKAVEAFDSVKPKLQNAMRRITTWKKH